MSTLIILSLALLCAFLFSELNRVAEACDCGDDENDGDDE